MTEITNEELDRRTAIEVMGWSTTSIGGIWVDKNHKLVAVSPPGDYVGNILWWHPSTDLNQAWQVVEKILLDKPNITVTLTCYKNIEHKVIYFFDFRFDLDEIVEMSDYKLPRAICLAVLQVNE